jgi:hypothetical protein
MCLTNLRFHSSSMSTDTRSCYRRKPLQTYKSPTADEQLSSGCSSSTTTTKSKSSTKSSTQGLGVKKDKDGAMRSTTNKGRKPILVQCRCPRSPPLPLFHPLGKLARSLPPLDPTLYGLPVLAVPDGLEERQSGSGRKKNGVGTRKRSRDVEEDVSESTRQGNGLSGDVAVAERTSPRKRRTGGGGNKRKRKDGEEADASYPAKKTRVPRGSQNGGDDGDDAVVEGQSNSNEVVGDVSDLVEKRRSRRNRGGTAAVRRESSESETTTGSVTAQGHERIIYLKEHGPAS